ncbi:unnamed protein product [Gongylonema pulchrum]|uniref:Uncharacterized protein n=1 Tax=Gongylonema pulchrum TaxID=637853 RepID=A0A183ECZ2_9BILA|nr:unnamed protein product [Gongylonema pulchrum]
MGGSRAARAPQGPDTRSAEPYSQTTATGASPEPLEPVSPEQNKCSKPTKKRGDSQTNRRAGYRNGYNLNPLTRIYERASLVPAAAAIPALKVYIVIAAVKKLVVGSSLQDPVRPFGRGMGSEVRNAGFLCATSIGRTG